MTADYYPLIERAVAVLSPDTREQRDELYERARKALLQQLQTLQPPLSGAEIAAELWALDEAIAQLETPARADGAPAWIRRGQPAQPKPAPQPARPVETVPSPAIHAQKTTRDVPRRPRRLLPVHKVLLAVYAVGFAIIGFFVFGPMADTKMHFWEKIIATIVWAAIPLIWLGPATSAWYRRKRCREAGLIKHRVRAFASGRATPEQQRAIARQLNDRRLFWCHFLPEHRQQAKDIIRDELKARGYSQQALDAWAPAPADVTVPPSVEGPLSRRHHERLIRFRTRYFHFYRVAVLAWVLFIAGTIIITTIQHGWSSLRQIDLKAVMSAITVPMLLLAGLAALMFRNRAMRILLLRPFGEKRMTAALKRFVRKNIGRAGNVFTLSDRNYKPNIFITILWRLPLEGFDTLILMIVGPFMGSTKRIASVKRERKFRKLERHLLRKYSPSFWSFAGGNQAFNIRSSDPWWQMCIHMLMQSCEVIVIDLSKVKEGTAWELNQLHAKGVLDKCVFVVGERDVGDVEPVLERYFPGETQPTVYVYGDNGKLADRPAYDGRVHQIMAAGLAAGNR
ncbi:MAG: hypothetical protein ACRECO_03415 [Xanthobacteraceae bacterium]